jgi:hypothetical protein
LWHRTSILLIAPGDPQNTPAVFQMECTYHQIDRTRTQTEPTKTQTERTKTLTERTHPALFTAHPAIWPFKVLCIVKYLPLTLSLLCKQAENKITQTLKTKYMSLRNNKLSQALLNRTTKFALAAALFLTVGIGSSFAAPAGDGNDIVIASFHKEFRTADVLQVETKKDYTKVTFKMNDVVMFAYYSANGDLMAVVRNIVSTQLPIRLLMELKQKHPDCWITDLFEMDANGQTVYYAALENSDTKVTLRADNSSNWETYQKENKENIHL